jgi:Dolichyl-phosphate-mannose-protein mannosyltransferase
MSALTVAGRHGLGLVGRLLDALTDPVRRDRTAAMVILGYVAAWTVYAAIAKGSQDIHVDMSEQFVLARELAWGYPKHPPLAMVLVRGWFAVFPTTDWAYYLLAMATVGVTLWVVWLLSARYLDGEKRAVGLALLTLVPFFNFHALKFNVNTILMPLWAVTMLAFLRSFESRRVLDAALAGLGAAACMYGKYWSVVLLIGLGVAALADSRRAAYFRSPAPWVTIAVGALALAPHGAWLVTNDFVPFTYAVAVHGAASTFASSASGAFGYLAASVGYVAVPLIIIALMARPNAAAIRDMAWPPTPERRLAALAFWAVLVVPAMMAPLARVQLVSIWSMSAWTLLPVMLLSSPLVAITRHDALRVLALAIVFPLVMIAAAPAIAIGIHRYGQAAGVAHSSVVVEPLERLWRETTDAPLQNFAGYDEFTDGVSFYMRNHPFAAHALEVRAGTVPQAVEARIDRDGLAMLCPARTRHGPSANWCVIAARSRALCFIPGKEREIEVARRFVGVEGKPARYLLMTIPPWQIDKLPSLRQPVEDYAAAHFNVEWPQSQ